MKKEILCPLLIKVHRLFMNMVREKSTAFHVDISRDSGYEMWYELPENKRQSVYALGEGACCPSVRIDFITILGMISEYREVQKVGMVNKNFNQWSIHFIQDITEEELLDSVDTLFVELQKTFDFLHAPIINDV